MDPKTLPTIWGTFMKLVTKYQISAINRGGSRGGGGASGAWPPPKIGKKYDFFLGVKS
jgi:hypothetical protein